MNKPFDVSIEQLAHDLALLTVAKHASGVKEFQMADYYKDYVNDYAYFKQIIENDMKDPAIVTARPIYTK